MVRNNRTVVNPSNKEATIMLTTKWLCGGYVIQDNENGAEKVKKGTMKHTSPNGKGWRNETGRHTAA